MPKGRKKAKGGGAGRWLLLALLILIGLAFWVHRSRPATWNRWFGTILPASTGAVSSPATPSAAPVPPAASSPTGSVSAACGGPWPNLAGHALAQARDAKFTTIEQLKAQLAARSATAPSDPVRLEATLVNFRLDGQTYQLTLASLVNPALTLTAELPAGACIANPDDAALADELRQDFALRFSTPTATTTAPPTPAHVVVTGLPVATGPGRFDLRPVLDFKVQ